jgi:hypothetical protein
VCRRPPYLDEDPSKSPSTKGSSPKPATRHGGHESRSLRNLRSTSIAQPNARQFEDDRFTIETALFMY